MVLRDKGWSLQMVPLTLQLHMAAIAETLSVY